MPIPSLVWAIAFSLFLGGLGVPIPENPLLIGGGYAIYLGAAPLWASLAVWYGAICLGDFILYCLAFLFFKHPRPAASIRRWLGAQRLDTYQQAFGVHGAWTLFLARFAWGVRLLAYVAAGAAQYPWKRFLLVDSLSVLVQVLLFAGLGYLAGDQIEVAQRTGDRIVLVLGVGVLIFIALAWAASRMMKRIPPQSAGPPPVGPPAPQPAPVIPSREVNFDHGRSDPPDL